MQIHNSEQYENQTAAPKKRSRKKLVILTIFFVVLIAVIIAIIFWLKTISKPVSSSVSISQKGNTLVNTGCTDLTPVLQTGTYISFDYPKCLRLISSALADPATSLESYNYYVKDAYSWTLAIDVAKASTGITGLSAYQIRIKDPGTYSLSSEIANAHSVVIFTDTSFTQGFSKVAFLSNSGEVATISLIGNDYSGLSPLVTSFNMLLNSVVWR